MSTLILNEIAENWHLEAKAEDSDRYFYHLKYVDKILNGKKYYVIGRKGTGKTAIAEHLNNISDSKIFQVKLSFKNFPFNELYNLYNEGYTVPNQYISIWKYVIYSHVAKLMISNENIDSQIRGLLQDIYEQDPERLEGKIKKWTATGFNVNVLKIGVGVTGQYSEQDAISSWIDKVDVLEKILNTYLDDSKYIIIFDALDEDYKNILSLSKSQPYLQLITSLFKSVQDIRNFFSNGKYIYPIIFLRDDIYDLLKDADKNKWNDLCVELDWDIASIKNMLAFRLSKAADEKCIHPLPFQEAWNSIFSDEKIKYGNKQRHETDLFSFITKSTHLRPRDFMRYIQTCAEIAIDKNLMLITPAVVRAKDKAFSNYLKNELIDELYAIFPNVDKIFDLLSQIKKPFFSVEEFKKAHGEHLSNTEGLINEEKEPDFILKTLFHFSVIGNQNKKQMEFFRYRNKDAKFNFTEPVVVHRGLLKALQIY